MGSEDAPLTAFLGTDARAASDSGPATVSGKRYPQSAKVFRVEYGWHNQDMIPTELHGSHRDSGLSSTTSHILT